MAKSSSTTKKVRKSMGFSMGPSNNDIPLSYSESIWDIAQQNSDLAAVMLAAGAAPSGSQTGVGQYGQDEINEALASGINAKESSSNKKTSIDEYSTDADYPSAKAVYGFVNDKVEEKTAICRGTFLSQSLLPNKSICPDLKHGDYAFVNGDNNLGPNTNHYLYVETPKITLNSDTRTYTFKEQVSNEGATFPYKWGGGAGVNYMEVYTAVKFPGNGSKAASSYDTPVDDAEYTVYDHIVHGGWVFTRALGNGAVPATHIQDTAAQSTNLAQVMGATGQFGQEEINEALAASADSSVKMDIGTDPSQADDNVTIFIDTDDDNSIEVYTKTQIDAMLAGYIQVQRYASNSQFPATGSLGVLYVNTTTGKTYAWDGSDYFPTLEGKLFVTGSGDPSVAPAFVGQEYIDQTNKKVYKAVSQTDSANDWVLLN